MPRDPRRRRLPQLRRSKTRAGMTTFLTALGLVFVIEGFLYGGVPRFAKHMAKLLLETPEETLRVAGIFAALLGLSLIWVARHL
jgi:uncharacterized protein